MCLKLIEIRNKMRHIERKCLVSLEQLIDEQILPGDRTFGKELGLLHEVVIAARKHKMGHAFWKLLQESPDALSRAIEGARTFPTYRCSTKNVRKESHELVSLGNYDIVDVRKGTNGVDESRVEYGDNHVDVSLYILPRTSAQRAIQTTLEGLGYRVGTFTEMLLLGIEHPDLQCQYRIACAQRIFAPVAQDTAVHLTARKSKRVIETFNHYDLTLKGVSAGTAIPCVRIR